MMIIFKDSMFTENPMEREDVEEIVKVETVRGNFSQRKGWQIIF